MTDATDGETIFLVNGVGIALSPRRRRQLTREAERAEGLAAARDFRRRMDEAYAEAEFPLEQRRMRRGV